MKHFKQILPDYPRTSHVPHRPNASADDLIASDKEIEIIFQSNNVFIEEKIDGSQCGMALYEGQPIIRNSTHILRKGYSKDTPAKQQFVNVFNWFYKNKELFTKLGDYGVYGEWMVATHGIKYNNLPSHFMAFDLFDYHAKKFVETYLAKEILSAAGFSVTPLLHSGKIESLEQLETLTNQPSVLTNTENQEGIYIKVCDDRWVTHRFKMVRPDFVRGQFWDGKTLQKNLVRN